MTVSRGYRAHRVPLVPHSWRRRRFIALATAPMGRRRPVEFLADGSGEDPRYRIEPAEIEHRLREIEGVKDVVVLAVKARRRTRSSRT